jgi:signal transduction histidine kinase
MTILFRWWRGVRAAGRGRVFYEAGLAVVVAATVAALTVLLGDLPVLAVAGFVVVDLALTGLRLVHPATAIVLAAATGVAAGRIDWPLIVVLAYAAGFRIASLPRLAAALGGVYLLQLAAMVRVSLESSVPGSLLWQTGFFMVQVALPAVVARLSAQRRQILTLMHERTVHLSAQQGVVAERARVREAHRIAREMHDSLGHRLTLLSLYTGALRAAPTGERQDETLRLLHGASTSAMEELRTILDVLREEGGDTGPVVSLAEVDTLVGNARDAGAEIELARSGEPVEVPPMVDQAAYRTLQEGVTNALRHARGSMIKTALRYEEGALIAEVRNGPGAPHDGPTTGQGLYGLAERVRLAGGILYHGPEPGGGFRVAATLPLTTVAPQKQSAGEATGGDEFADQLRRADGRRRAWTAALGLSVVLVPALCAGGLYLFATQMLVSRATFDGLRIGDGAASVREKLPDPKATLDPAGVSPAAPAGVDCVEYASLPIPREGETDPGYRFCFRDDKLIAKEILDDAG